MKALNQYIHESILDSDEDIDNKKLVVSPNTYGELYDIIIKSLENGKKDLNFIDTFKITDMADLFHEVSLHFDTDDILESIDISNWDVSNVKFMEGMFSNCYKFNSDISDWNVSKAENMTDMFYNCNEFDQDLNNWKPKKVKYKDNMFYKTKLEKENKLPKWYE